MDKTLKVSLHITQTKVFFPNPVINYFSDLAEPFRMAAVVSGFDAARDEQEAMNHFV